MVKVSVLLKLMSFIAVLLLVNQYAVLHAKEHKSGELQQLMTNHDAGLAFRYGFGVTFLVLAVAMMIHDRRHLFGLRDRALEFRDALKERAGVT